MSEQTVVNDAEKVVINQAPEQPDPPAQGSEGQQEPEPKDDDKDE